MIYKTKFYTRLFFLVIILFSVITVKILAQTNAPAAAPATPTNAQKSVIENGFGALVWGSNYETVKQGIKGSLSYAEENKIVVSKDGDVNYRYGFFYVDPVKIGKTANETVPVTAPAPTTPAIQANQPVNPAAAPTAADIANQVNAEFSYMVIDFPYLSIDSVKEKYIAKYGNPTTENVKDMRGAIVWDSENTIIILWVDSYEKKPYCRKINYISKNIAKKVDKYYELIFNQKEIDTLKKINP